MGLRIAVSDKGKLTISLVGVHGTKHRPIKLGRGTHTIHMALPASARARGTVIVKLKVKLSTRPRLRQSGAPCCCTRAS